MADFTLRPLRVDDEEQIIKIWCSSFGDSEDFVRALLCRCGLIASGVGAEADGRIRCAMFAFDGLECREGKASYLYALCTEQSYRSRGMGRAVTAYAADEAYKRGAALVFLRPGDSGLEAWYADALSARAFVRGHVERFYPPAPASCKALPIESEEYFRRRPANGWRLSPSLIRAQELIHRHYGGEFLDCGGDILCAEKKDGGVLIREMFALRPAEALAAAGEYFGTEEIYILRSCEKGGTPLMILGQGPDKNTKNMPLMPFTLD